MNLKLVLRISLLLAGIYLCNAEVKEDVNIENELEHFTQQRFPNSDFREEHEKARKHIKDQFKRHGCQMQTQQFNTSVTTSLGYFDPVDEYVIGENIICIADAVGNRPESVIVVAADYDTNGIRDPLLNNGAGIAVLLETARLFLWNVQWSGAFKQNFTTIFVALDLNTRDHSKSGGKPGGWYFVNEWLWEYLGESDVNFGGAYILDHIMNFNDEDKSQRLGEEFKEMFPETFERAEAGNRKGNFLSMVTPNNEKSQKLVSQFETGYNMERIKRPFRLEDMTLPKTLSPGQILEALTHQDSFHFWTFELDDTSNPLPAVLLTDTESLRDVPAITDCNEELCQLTPEREEFLEATTMGLLRTLLKRQATTLPNTGTYVTSIPALILALVMAVLVRNAH